MEPSGAKVGNTNEKHVTIYRRIYSSMSQFHQKYDFILLSTTPVIRLWGQGRCKVTRYYV